MAALREVAVAATEGSLRLRNRRRQKGLQLLVAGRVPSMDELEALLPLVDAGAVRVQAGLIFLEREGMELDLGGVATSGDYERFFAKDGVRYHHLLDATTGWPARGLCSVTVIAPTTSAAGRLATAAFLLGPEAGLNLLEAQAGVEGALITTSNEMLCTAGMERIATLVA